ncbi:MAG: hypothetical protein ACFFG0_03415 [Candidatus Thorarchaeota archaeon]
MSKRTCTQLRNIVARDAGDMSTTGLARAVEAINAAQEMLADFHKWNDLKRSGTLALTAGTRTYATSLISGITEDLDEIYGLRYIRTRKAIPIKYIMNEDNWWDVYDDDSSGGDPENFRIIDNEIEFDIIPNSNFVTNYSPIKVQARILPTALDTTTNNSTDFSQRFEQLIMTMAKEIVLGNQEDFPAMQFFSLEAQRIYKALRKRDMFSARNSRTLRIRKDVGYSFRNRRSGY